MSMRLLPRLEGRCHYAFTGPVWFLNTHWKQNRTRLCAGDHCPSCENYVSDVRMYGIGYCGRGDVKLEGLIEFTSTMVAALNGEIPSREDLVTITSEKKWGSIAVEAEFSHYKISEPPPPAELLPKSICSLFRLPDQPVQQWFSTAKTAMDESVFLSVMRPQIKWHLGEAA